MAVLQMLATATGFKILFLVPTAVPSHWVWMKNFAEELLNRGHHVSTFDLKMKFSF